MAKKIDVHTKFTVRVPMEPNRDAFEHTFNPGVHKVSDTIADHWYTKLHAVVVDEVPADKETVGAELKDPPPPSPVQERMAYRGPGAEETQDKEDEPAARGRGRGR